ncbi:MAG: hypoxanthine-guanine phosphoribosyltransferase [Xanthomonadales bacterium]|nr:hypoxanthine-guanine phosphoribosyltransferase [Xanthomonadales bacterium]
MGLETQDGALDPQALLDRSYVVYDREQVAQAMDALAAAVNDHYQGQPIVLIGVMTGAVLPMAWLATRLNMPMTMDFVHATRYRSGVRGHELEYRVPPRLDLRGQHVLVIDDIFDEGHTLAAIKGSVEQRQAASVKLAALVRKQHDRGLSRETLDFHGLDVPDVYVYGCGMDAYEHWRQLDCIMALELD